MQSPLESTNAAALQSSMISAAFNSLKTGNQAMDMLISFLLVNLATVIIGMISKVFMSVYEKIKAKWFTPSAAPTAINPETSSVTLDDKESKTPLFGSGEERQKNLMLSVLTYVLENHSDELNQSGAKLVNFRKNCSYNSDREYHKQFKIQPFPTFVDVRTKFENVTLSISYNFEAPKDGPNGATAKNPLVSDDPPPSLGKIIITGPKGCNKLIHNFLDHVWNSYIDTNFPAVVNERPKKYYYSPCTGTDSYGRPGLRFKQYPLENRRTFDATFFPQKKHFLQVLDNFLKQQGTYANPNIPWKMGILLHGPPGCGKTTFIKSLANYTNRSVQNVDLRMVRSNAELHGLFFGHNILGEGGSHWNVSQSKRIIVCEDFDAGSSVVKKRVTEEEKKEDKSKSIEETFSSKDGFDLSTFLNTLDGVLELEGLIWVFTTNHIEKIDPALIRPGRMSVNIHMTHMKLDEIVELFQFYYPKETIDRNTFDGFDIDGKYTPAQVECACQQSFGVQESIKSLLQSTK